MLEEYTLEEQKQQEGRSPDSLIQAIDRIERLERQLKIAVRGLSFIVAQSYGKDMWDCAKDTLKQIEELENERK